MCLDCNCGGSLGRFKEIHAEKSIEVIGVEPIKVDKIVSGTLTTYVISYNPYIPPTCSLVVSPNVVEIGRTFNATYISTWSKGDAKLGEDDLDGSPYASSVNGMMFMETGLKGVKELVVDDGRTTVSATAGITVQHRYYVGYKLRDTGEIVKDDGVIAGSMKIAYGDLRGYTVGNGDSYIVWLVPISETMGAVTDSNNFLCETIETDQVLVTNQYGVTIVYKVIQSKNFYPSGSTLTLKF